MRHFDSRELGVEIYHSQAYTSSYIEMMPMLWHYY